MAHARFLQFMQESDAGNPSVKTGGGSTTLGMTAWGLAPRFWHSYSEYLELNIERT